MILPSMILHFLCAFHPLRLCVKNSFWLGSAALCSFVSIRGLPGPHKSFCHHIILSCHPRALSRPSFVSFVSFCKIRVHPGPSVLKVFRLRLCRAVFFEFFEFFRG